MQKSDNFSFFKQISNILLSPHCHVEEDLLKTGLRIPEQRSLLFKTQGEGPMKERPKLTLDTKTFGARTEGNLQARVRVRSSRTPAPGSLLLHVTHTLLVILNGSRSTQGKGG